MTEPATTPDPADDWRRQRPLLVVMAVVAVLLGGFGLWLAWALLTGGSAPLVGDVDQHVVLGIIAGLLTFPIPGGVLRGIVLGWMLWQSRSAR